MCFATNAIYGPPAECNSQCQAECHTLLHSACTWLVPRTAFVFKSLLALKYKQFFSFFFVRWELPIKVWSTIHANRHSLTLHAIFFDMISLTQKWCIIGTKPQIAPCTQLHIATASSMQCKYLYWELTFGAEVLSHVVRIRAADDDPIQTLDNARAAGRDEQHDCDPESTHVSFIWIVSLPCFARLTRVHSSQKSEWYGQHMVIHIQNCWQFLNRRVEKKGSSNWPWERGSEDRSYWLLEREWCAPQQSHSYSSWSNHGNTHCITFLCTLDEAFDNDG